MATTVTGSRSTRGARAFLALGVFLCLGAGCAASGGVKGRVLLPAPPAGDAAARSGPAAAGGGSASEIVVCLIPEGADRRGASAAHQPRRGATAEVSLTAAGPEPDVLTVSRGTTVRFRNRDSVYHKLFSVSPACRFDLEPCAPGQEVAAVFDQAGVVNVFCELHPKGGAVVIVLPDGRTTRPGADGRFALTGVRPGKYTLKAWHPTLGEASARVAVAAGKQAQVKLVF